MRSARVLFVCTGNICRSPTAEAVLRKAAAEAGLAARILCDSAGLTDWQVGKAPDPRAVQAGALRGYEMIEGRARQFHELDYDDFDLLVGMDSGHAAYLRRQCPKGASVRIARFLDFSPALAAEHGPDVPDPYTGTAADYEHALDLIEQGMPGLLAVLRREYL